ncbi:hypothetical protein BS50DRAFT_179483 [Corynespora cassiicola Philippines]|uniref:Uncharacterized protein n=1 Tax=Corynespora cassiicola Philippines TaxID=1448308 RepID=A0A2T2P703_CORCC|nr:hypothetical protein BS50DRAFT_179483 [Corynespora cassiicola Philippines]
MAGPSQKSVRCYYYPTRSLPAGWEPQCSSCVNMQARAIRWLTCQASKAPLNHACPCMTSCPVPRNRWGVITRCQLALEAKNRHTPLPDRSATHQRHRRRAGVEPRQHAPTTAQHHPIATGLCLTARCLDCIPIASAALARLPALSTPLHFPPALLLHLLPTRTALPGQPPVASAPPVLSSANPTACGEQDLRADSASSANVGP